MAAKRVMQSAIDWAALAERVPPHQKAQYLAFKSKSDQYLRKVMALPEKPAPIDWNHYKAKVPIAGMVDEFKKAYESINIPYPPNTMTSQLDALENEIKADIQKHKAESDARIQEYKKKLAYINGLIPYDQMTMEDFRDAYPELALDPINRPTFWPHTPEEQLDYKDDKAVASGH